MRRHSVLLFAAMIVFLAGCQAGGGGGGRVSTPTAAPTSEGPPPPLPNILVAGEGVQVRRVDTLGFVPIALGAELRPGDLMRVAGDGAAIFCGAERDWETSPLALAAGKASGVACGAGRPPRPYADATAVRGDAGATGVPTVHGDNPAAPAMVRRLRVLSPRSGAVLSDRPTLAWEAVRDRTLLGDAEKLVHAAAYTVTLESDDGISRVTVASGSPLPYPEEWPSLQGEGASYRLVVVADGASSSEDTPGFSLLEDADEFRAKVARLEQRPLAEPARSLLQAELYLSYGLRSEAVELLDATPGAEQAPAVQSLLGDTYWNMGLVDRAKTAYTRLLELAQAGGYIEAQGDALVGLGRVACALADADGAEEYWGQARLLFTQNGRGQAAATPASLLAGVAAECR